ncbi:MAG: hypothetical protein HDR09_12295 [Lachnospiraceae bacterium]|nr:hypothetical protein [Lachnospiraceae bacterium]
MKSTKKNMTVIAVLLVAAIAAAGGFIIYNSTPKRLQRQLNAAEKCLTGQNYEQAIAEFDKAIEVDSTNERAYTGKIEACIGIEDYEQAAATYAAALRTVPRAGGVWSAAEQFYLDYVQTYIAAEDYARAGAILEEGYDLIGSRKIYDKIGETAEKVKQQEAEARLADGMIAFPFGIRDITVNGYDLLGDHFAQMRELYPVGEGYEVSNTNDLIFQEYAPDGSYYINTTTYGDGRDDRVQELWVNNEWSYRVYYYSGNEYGSQTTLSLNRSYGDQTADYEGLNVPVKPGSSYEDWCSVMQIERIKEVGEQPEMENNMFTIPDDGEYPSMTQGFSDGTECWVFQTDEYRGIYTERSDDYGVWCEFTFHPPFTYSGEVRAYHRIDARIENDGVISSVNYNFSCVN